MQRIFVPRWRNSFGGKSGERGNPRFGKKFCCHRTGFLASWSNMNRTQEVIQLLDGRKISAGRSEYHCLSANETSVVFGLSETTKKVMLPTELVLEWIQAFESAVISLDDSAREMRQKVVPRSSWAAFQHGFETHLFAIVSSWANRDR